MENSHSSTFAPLQKSTMEMVNSVLTNVIRFSWYDYILFSAMLLISSVIGIYFGCFGSKQSTTKEYLMGGKKMKVIPIAVSLTASHISGITLLALPADVYRFSATYLLSIIVAPLVALVTAYIFLPVFFKLQITSTYEYLEQRFDTYTRIFASFLFALGQFLYLPVVIYIPALAFSAATGISVHVVTPVVCGVCIFYTTIGGLKAVVWTDTLQFTVTLGALATVFTLGIRDAGGIQEIFRKAQEGDRLQLFDFSLDVSKRSTFWQIIGGLFIGWASMACVTQSCVQKFLSLETLKEAKLASLLFSLGMAVVTIVSATVGLVMYAKYVDCDPFSTGAIEKPDQLLPYFVMDVAGAVPGLAGLFIAGIFCAGLSTLSAHLNCLAGTIYEDFILKMIKKPTERTTGIILKLLVVVIGIICTLSVYLIEKGGSILPLISSLNSVCYPPTLALFTLGILVPRVNKKGALYGTMLGLIIMSAIIIVSQMYIMNGYVPFPAGTLSVDGCNNTFNLLTNQTFLTTTPSSFNLTSDDNVLNSKEHFQPFILFRLSFFMHSILGFVITLVCCLVISLLTYNKNDPLPDREVLSPIIYRWLPEKGYYDQNKAQYYNIEKAMHILSTAENNK